MRKGIKFSLIIVGAFAMFACKPKVEDMESSAGDINTSKFVVIGGSDMAGMMDDGLYYDGQINSVAAILSTQFELVGASPIQQALMPSSSVGYTIFGNAPLELGYKTDCLNVTGLSPVRSAQTGDGASFSMNTYSASAPITNFGIPLLSVAQLSTSGLGNPANGPGNYNPFFARMASNQATASVKSDILATQPTCFALSLGMDEVMLYAAGGAKNGGLISTAAFDLGLNDLVGSLTNLGAKGAIATIPDVTEFPYFTTIPYNGLNLDEENAATLNSIYNPIGIYFHVGANAFMIEDPTAGSFGVRQMVPGEKILLSVPLDSVKCNKMGSVFPFRDEFVLELSELTEIQNQIAGYNDVIRATAVNNSLALVDAHTFYQTLNAGIVYNGVSMNATFVSGGAYSLDGRTLNPRGNALLANQFIAAFNAKYNATIWQANATKYRGIKFP